MAISTHKKHTQTLYTSRDDDKSIIAKTMKSRQQQSIVIAPHRINSWKLAGILKAKTLPFSGSEQFSSCMMIHNCFNNEFLARLNFDLSYIRRKNKIMKT